MIKLIGTDFDGTLLDDKKNVPKENIKSLKKAKKQKIKIVGVTGRTLESVKNAIDISIFDYLILNNGANIYDINKQQTIYDRAIPFEIAKEITNLADEETFQFDYCTVSNYLLYKNFTNPGVPFIKEIKKIEEIDEPISKMNIFLKEGVNLKELLKRIKEQFPQVKASTMQDSGNDKKWIVITPENLNKKESLIFLGNYLDISPQEMVFFGDGLNDLEVMEVVGLGVAMGNALEEVKTRAKEVTDTNNNAGISKTVEKILMQK